MTTGRINLVSIVQGAREARTRREGERARAREGRASPFLCARGRPRALLGQRRRRAPGEVSPRGAKRAPRPHFEFREFVGQSRFAALSLWRRPFSRRGSSSENTREEADRPDAVGCRRGDEGKEGLRAHALRSRLRPSARRLSTSGGFP